MHRFCRVDKVLVQFMYGHQEMVEKTMTIAIVMAIRIRFILSLFRVQRKMAIYLGIPKHALPRWLRLIVAERRMKNKSSQQIYGVSVQKIIQVDI